MDKTCDGCKHGSICKLTSGLWKYYRDILQGRVEKSPDCMSKLLKTLAAACHHWEKYPEEIH